MERGTSTRGRMTKQVEGAGSIEIKATIPHKQVKLALELLGLKADTGRRRFIYFFDTPKLDLHRIGIITRARRNVGDTHDSTVKFRPVEPDGLPKRWHKYSGFKIEADASEKGTAKSA